MYYDQKNTLERAIRCLASELHILNENLKTSPNKDFKAHQETMIDKISKNYKGYSDSPKVCPRNHSIPRQLSEDGYCMDCRGYPLREGKPS